MERTTPVPIHLVQDLIKTLMESQEYLLQHLRHIGQVDADPSASPVRRVMQSNEQGIKSLLPLIAGQDPGEFSEKG